jgi:hypothetical protein
MREAAASPKRLRLQRLTEALRRRDWLGLVLELGVVTLGVLLAFEIEQWGERRARAAEERHFLERLYREYQRGVEELNDVITRNHDKVMSDFQKAFAARRDPVRLGQYAATNNFGCAAGYLRTTPFSDTAFQELVSSGRLSIVRDPELRTRIRDLTTEQASLKDRAAAGTEAARDQNAVLNPYYRYELMPDGSTRCFVDWPRLFDNPAAVTAAIRVYRMHELVGQGRVDLRRMIQEVRAEVGCELGKVPCGR